MMEEFGDDESEGSGELEEEDWDDLDSDSPTSFLSFGDEDDSAEKHSRATCEFNP